jgi:NAD(P)H-dependent FMN reductase
MLQTINRPDIGIIIGTNRPARIGYGIAEWLQNAMPHDNLDIDLIDLAKIDLPFLDEPDIPAHGHYQKEHTKAWSQLISRYAGFILLFPQYNWGYPAVLKNALDYLYEEWAGKPVSILCYGGHGGFQGALAMRLVTQGLRMRTMTTNIPLDITDDMFDEHGQFKNIAAALEPYRLPAQLLASEFAELLVK